MTEPLTEIGRAKELNRNSTRGETLKREKGKKHPREAEDDNVDISDEARSRALGSSTGRTN